MTAQDTIRFNVPAIEGRELEYVRTALDGGHTSASGPFSKKVGALLAEASGATEVLLTTSCTAALELAGMLTDIGPGDVVVVPDFTFTTTALAYARAGATLRYCDIEPRTLGMDPEHLATLMDERVKAVVPVHYAGVACDLDGIRKVLAQWPGATLIEDNAHGLFGTWHGQPLGSFGRFATLSFHETKNFICGEGGALLINDPADVDRARVLFDKGTNRQAFFLGQVDKYSWKDTGSSFGLSDTLAAQLYGQLEMHDQILGKRAAVWNRYAELVAPVADEFGLTLPVVPEGARQAFHMFYLLFPDQALRDRALAGMGARGVKPTFHYVPLHSSDAGRRFADVPGECPVSEDVSGRLLRLPFFNNLTAEQADRVVGALRASLLD
ncbi:dTDP-4-amino-4,6-dideoxygalactose transaminase [Nocardioides aromaticivorans]|uniref:dTDP-4-amino-4,6-dideoxygalactose transaminase n=1 Tax=Nocardioides aromaticivorans TaxID=200618 RepID=A0A7Y9ZFL6_9ACTN|nr:dTDP-4-amino-4,6-dideoxygalactose transaminase [Nocardioides aromaticivorans]NYI43638.1 dTDP-4-amino-4,6-dideoxygalactose transaminase [Nocardioides aromaticivorans]